MKIKTEILHFIFKKSKFTKILSKNKLTRKLLKNGMSGNPHPNLDPLVAGSGLHERLLIRRTSQDPSTSLNQINHLNTCTHTTRDEIVAKCYKIIPNINIFLSLHIFVQTLDETKYAQFKHIYLNKFTSH